MYGLNQRGDYFQDLCERLFVYQERHGIIEPRTELFIPVLLESEEIQTTLARNNLNVPGLIKSIGLFIAARSHVNGQEALFKDGQFYQARNPEPLSLSALYKKEAENIDGADMGVRWSNFKDYLSDRESESVTGLIEKCLMVMEEGNIAMSDINLLKQIISSPAYSDLNFGVRNTLQMYGVSSETLSEDYRSPNAAPLPAVR